MTGRRWSDGLHQARRGQGRRADPEREPDARVDHVPELLPHVRQALRHDRHRRHRSLPSSRRSTAWRRWSSRRTSRPSARTRLDLVYKTGGEIHAVIADIRDCHERGQPVLVGTTSIENSELVSGLLVKAEAAAPGAQRQAARQARPRSSPRPGGRGDHHRHQHGRPRHRHRARRQRREADPVPRSQPGTRRGRKAARARQLTDERQGLHDAVRPRADCASSPPSATSRGASTTSCAAARAPGRPGDRRASTCRASTIR